MNEEKNSIHENQKTFYLFLGAFGLLVVIFFFVYISKSSINVFSQPSVCKKIEVTKIGISQLSDTDPSMLIEIYANPVYFLEAGLKNYAALFVLSRFDEPLTIDGYSTNRSNEIRINQKELTFGKKINLYTKTNVDSLVEASISTNIR